MARSRVTIRDVARAARVSVATVSRVFNETAPVSEATRERVRLASESLRFVPNIAARSMSTGRLATLGVLLPDTHSVFYTEVLRGIGQVADERGYRLLLSGLHGKPVRLRTLAHGMAGLVDGLIVMAPEEAEPLVGELPASVPVVLVNSRAQGQDVVVPDDHSGAYAMVRHLLGHGHRVIGLIRGPAANYDAEERARGYHAAIREAGVGVSSCEVDGDFTEASGYRAARAILRRAVRPTAVFAANDSMAIGALRAFHEAGLRVPGDVAVAGFDDLPTARFMTPPLATVRVPIAELGVRACERLLLILEAEERPAVARAVVPAAVVPRGSCGCAGPESEGGSALVPEPGIV